MLDEEIFNKYRPSMKPSMIFTVMMIIAMGLLMIMHCMPFYRVGHPTSMEFVSFGPNFGPCLLLAERRGREMRFECRWWRSVWGGVRGGEGGEGGV